MRKSDLFELRNKVLEIQDVLVDMEIKVWDILELIEIVKKKKTDLVQKIDKELKD